MTRPSLCAFFGLAVTALIALPGGCSCDDKSGRCPASFAVGDPCGIEGLVCVWPESYCRTTQCTCVNAVGGFYWKCESTWCRCTCACGRTARTSCETLKCSSAADPCPPEAADVCELTCRDLGPPDQGPDLPLRDARPEGSRRDAPVDGRRDQAHDTFGPELDSSPADQS